MPFSHAALACITLATAVALVSEMDYQEARAAEIRLKATWCECVQRGHTDLEVEMCDAWHMPFGVTWDVETTCTEQEVLNEIR